MPGDLVAHDHTVTAEADLDPVLRYVDDRPASRDRISADRNRGIRPVRDDPTFLIEGDGIAGDRTGRTCAIAERAVINPNAVLRAVKRLLANIMDITVGDIHRRCAEMSEALVNVTVFAGGDDAKVVGAIDVAAFDGSAGSRPVIDADIAAGCVDRLTRNIPVCNHRGRQVHAVADKTRRRAYCHRHRDGGTGSRALASAIPVTSDTASFFFMYFLPGLIAETLDRAAP